MLHKILLLFSAANLSAFALHNWKFNILTNNTRQTAKIGDTLRIPIKELSYLHLLLRSQHFHNDVSNAYLYWFLKHIEIPGIIGTYEDSLNPYKPDLMGEFLSERGNFVISTDTKQLNNIAHRFVNRVGTFFFILCNEVSPKDFTAFRHVLSSLWIKYSSFKNYLLTNIGVFIYDPFHYDTERLQYGEIVPYDGKAPLERKLFQDMRGYPLRGQIFKAVYSHPRFKEAVRRIQDVGGVDGRVAELLQQRLKFTMDLQEPDPNYFGEHLPNGSYNGAIGSIIDNKLDLCLTGFFVKDYMVSNYMDFTVAVYDDQLCIFAQKAKRIPQSILPIFAVRFDLWLGFILTAFICAFIWGIIRRLNLLLGIDTCANTPLHEKQSMQFIRIYIDTWVLWVRVDLVRYPPFNSERVYIATLCLVSVIFGAIFESSLATVYIHPLYYKDINTLQDLDDSNLKIIYKFSAMADDLFFNETSPLFANLHKKLTHWRNLDIDVRTDVAYNGGKAGVTRLTKLLLESLHLIRSKHLWIVPECPKYYTISYVMPKHAPWEEAVNIMLLNFVSAGFIKKWIQDTQAKVEVEVMKTSTGHNENESLKVLTVTDLQLAFYVILLGNGLGALSLLLECCLDRWKTTKNTFSACGKLGKC